jgi:hypothetical protein
MCPEHNEHSLLRSSGSVRGEVLLEKSHKGAKIFL